MIEFCNHFSISRRRRAVGLAGLALFFVSACATKTEATRYYLLSDPGQSVVSPQSQCAVRLGSVAIAPYLQRTHIVLQSGSNELIPALQHRWSEPLDAGVRRLLSSCLRGHLDTPYSANVTIDHLHGNTAGTVVLQAHWSVSGLAPEVANQESASMPASGVYSGSQPQPQAGYDALVSTQRELVLGLCSAIQAAVPTC